jgi:hypothetical protein
VIGMGGRERLVFFEYLSRGAIDAYIDARRENVRPLFLRHDTSGIQRLVSYLVRSTRSGNVRVSARFRFTQLFSAVKNGVPPPTRTGWVTIAYSSISRPAWPPRRGWHRRRPSDRHRRSKAG